MSAMSPILDQETQALIVNAWQGYMGLGYLDKPRLGPALSRVLAHPGSMTRAQTAYAVMTNGGRTTKDAAAMAVAVEYFHTASLLLDDLPCMDDAEERRGQTCPHVDLGEDTAILAALALINKAYALIWPLLVSLSPQRALAVSSLLDHCLGVSGLIGGQARDLNFGVGKHTAAEVAEIADGKTGSLFRVCLAVPAMAAPCADHQVELLDALAQCWGRAYQLADDFKDLAGSGYGKTAARDAALSRPNMVLASGFDKAATMLKDLTTMAERLIDRLNQTSGDWQFLTILNDMLIHVPDVDTANASAA